MTTEEQLRELLRKGGVLCHADPNVQRGLTSMYEAMAFLAREIDSLKNRNGEANNLP